MHRFLIGTLILLAACAKSAQREDAAPALEVESVLEVDNRRFYDMTIYVIRAGTRLRIGVAPGLSLTSFSLKRNIIGVGTDLQFLADPIGGGRSPVSQSLYVSPGEIVRLTISP